MVCIDTNIVIDFLKGRKSVTKKIFSLDSEGYEFAVSPITVYEVLFGSWFYNSKEIPKVEQFFDSVTVLDFNYECASVASVIHSSSMRSGCDIGVMDSLIAATAWIHDKHILTNDDHFNVINSLGIEIENKQFSLEVITIK
ncbi:MAG: type II toxin-antitoxin system VapC family toxin [Methanosarcinales archaeon]|nr:type II toxin-antitoxin system VapC family toxin [Methanosarcinales archaeon]